MSARARREAVRLVVSTGSPAGIGPDVSLLATMKLPRGSKALLLGDFQGLRERARLLGLDPSRLVRARSAEVAFASDSAETFVLAPHAKLSWRAKKPGAPSPEGGAAALGFIDAGCDLVARGAGDALVTGPVSKAEIASSGAEGSRTFLGHTEHLMALLGAPSVTMAFWSRKFTTSLVTTHLAVKDVPKRITKAAVVRATLHTARFLAGLAGGKPQRLVVSGLNPHAGEDGLLGREEIERISPAIVEVRGVIEREGLAVVIEGPVPAESALRLAHEGHYAGAVTMFHDQATIAMKLTGFGEAVNVSLGLPIVRTSVDHGTAFDRAGTGRADPLGMREAIGLAVRMVRGTAR